MNIKVFNKFKHFLYNCNKKIVMLYLFLNAKNCQTNKASRFRNAANIYKNLVSFQQCLIFRCERELGLYHSNSLKAH